MKTYHVYILKCSDGSYYTGITNNLEIRFAQHQEGTMKTAYTYSRRPLELLFAEAFYDVRMAIAWEKRIKGWSRAKKEALINDNWAKLKELSICQNSTRFIPDRGLGKRMPNNRFPWDVVLNTLSTSANPVKAIFEGHPQGSGLGFDYRLA